MSQEVDDFLAHFGKKGMKWGQRRNGNMYTAQQMAKKNARADKGAAILAKNKGSVKRYAAKEVGKTVGVTVLANVGAFAVSKIVGTPSAAQGAAFIANAAITGYQINQINNAINVRQAVNRNKG
jgi:hypothetical protein